MTIKTFFARITEGRDLIIDLLQSDFMIDKNKAELLFDRIINPHMERIRPNCFIVAESPYIDKVYRDSYYNYYSSKLSQYKRDTIRISIFDEEVIHEDFRDEDSIRRIAGHYLGFIVIRPTEPALIGRNVIAPKALLTNGFKICNAKFQATTNSVKFEVDGFPHSSQDSETISCAETSLWALMEYFGNKYSEYKPVLPSSILKTLKQVSSERQVPSKGLNIQQMSFALKKYGFGSRIYSRQQYHYSFGNLLSCYIESGIPVVIAMENSSPVIIGHALLCIGHEHIKDIDIDNAMEAKLDIRLTGIKLGKNIQLYDYDDINKSFIFIDDNQPSYQIAELDKPAIHYPNPVWHTCKITYFIAPLYPKIYLEAFEAKNFFIRFILLGPSPISDGSNILIRCFLASSRTFKDSIARNKTMIEDLQGLILETSMPKFIWVAEMTDKDLLKNREAKGLIIVDATEANVKFNKPLILAAYDNNIICYEQSSGNLENYSIPLHNFCIFDNNLKN